MGMSEKKGRKPENQPPPGPPGAKPPQQGVQIQIDEANVHGVYSNLVVVSHSENEFVLDYIHVLPQQAGAKIRARVLVGPRQMKRMLRAFAENMARYEQVFGVVAVADQPAPGGKPLPSPAGGTPNA